MKRYVFFSLFLVTVLCGKATERTFEQKRRAAIEAISIAKRHAATPTSSIRELKRLDELTLLGYDSGGFAIISNDDRHDAVIGYSDAKIDVDALPDGFKWWLSAADEALKNSSGYSVSAYSAPAGAGYRETVDMLVTTKWGQGDPYNRQCPLSGTSHTLTGCVATAMAQIMNYHKYPDRAVSASIPAYGIVLGDAYDWGNMLDTYTAGTGGEDLFTTAQADAVAMLMAHCGATVNMNYGTSASGAFSFNVSPALRNKFMYNENLNYRYRGIHTTAEWMDMIYNEISNGRPILYGAVDAHGSGGHAFVLDGYNAEGLVHVNWGWEGSADGYYDVALLNPTAGDPPAYMEYSQQQDMVMGISLPDTNIEYSREIGTQSDIDIKLQGNKLMVTLADYSLTNFDTDTGVRGTICLLLSDGGTITNLGNIKNNISIQPINLTEGKIYSSSISATASVDIPVDLADGEYLVYAGLCDLWDPETLYKIYYGDGAVGCYILNKNAGGYTLSQEATSGIHSVSIKKDIAVDEGIYSIDGRRINRSIDNLPHGIYIVNGKKVMK